MYLGKVLARTKNLTLDRSHSARLLRRWSTSRPGVATTTCGRLSSSMACAIISIPPTMTAVRTLRGEPSTVNCSAIWNASSLRLLKRLHAILKTGQYLVGVSTSAKIPYGSTESFCRMGSAKAMVFPEPVFAFPIQSLPYKIAIVSEGRVPWQQPRDLQEEGVCTPVVSRLVCEWPSSTVQRVAEVIYPARRTSLVSTAQLRGIAYVDVDGPAGVSRSRENQEDRSSRSNDDQGDRIQRVKSSHGFHSQHSPQPRLPTRCHPSQLPHLPTSNQNRHLRPDCFPRL